MTKSGKEKNSKQKSDKANNDKSKKRALIFGAGNNFIYSCHLINQMYCIVGVADNSPQKQGMELFGFRIRRFDEFDRESFDVVIVTPSHAAAMIEQLHQYGGMENKVLRLDEALHVEYEKEEADLQLAVILYGGMGDFLIGKNWLYHLAAHVGLDKPMIDIYVSRKDFMTAKSVFDDSDLINRVCEIDVEIPELLKEEAYDLILWFSVFPLVQTMKEEKLVSGNPKLYSYASKLKEFGMLHYNRGFFAAPDFYKTVYELFQMQPFKKYHAHFDVLDNLGASDKTLCPISVKLEEESYLALVGLKKKRYITINTGMNREYREKASTRAWKLKKWEALSYMVKQNFPEWKVVQIGLRITEHDDIHADLNLTGATTLEETKVLLKNALLHIDYDSGLVHLRHMLSGGTSVVLLGALGVEKHCYPENICVRTDVCVSACEWTTADWLSNCPRGFKEPVCMESLTPEIVFEKVSEYLSMYTPTDSSGQCNE